MGRAAVHGSELIGGAGVLQVALGHTAPLGRAKPGEGEGEAEAEAEAEAGAGAEAQAEAEPEAEG